MQPVTVLALLFYLVDGIEGMILDPHDRGVPSAAVMLTCGDYILSTVTSDSGRFAFEAVSRDDCSLEVRRAGFAPAVEPVRDHAGRPITIRLSLAPLVTDVRVVGSATDREPFGLVFAEDDFRLLAQDVDALIRFAQARAGVVNRSRMIYVDGMPASALPPIDMIARVAVNTDPFSAEYTNGDTTAIHITTRAPARRLRFYTGGTAVSVGGGDVFASRSDRPDVLSGNFGVMGPIPRLPLTFSITGSGSRDTRVRSVRAVLPSTIDVARAADVTATSRNIGVGVELNYARTASSRARVTYRQSHSDARNVGAGELSLLETAAFTKGMNRDGRVTANRVVGGRTIESGFTVAMNTADLVANSTALGIAVPGQFSIGGGPLAFSSSNRTQLMSKHVVRSGSARPWSAGIVFHTVRQSAGDTANPYGLVEFDSIDSYDAALAGAATGTLVKSRDTSVSHRSVTVAPFVHKVIWRRDNSTFNAGLRADYQRPFGTIVSPRLSLATTWQGFSIAGGSGLFAREIPNAVVWRTVRDASRDGRQFMAQGVSLTELPTTLQPIVHSLTSQLSPAIERPREWMSRVSIDRPLGDFTASVEYTHSRDSHLLGSRRDRSPQGWIDTFESNRRAVRNRLSSQLRFRHGRQYASVHYEWTRSRDNTDGPWSFAEQQGDIRSEWAPSSGVPPHTVAATVTLSMPGAISLNMTDVWSSGSPYTVTTGFDRYGEGLWLDRGGRPRNSAMTPATNELSLYANRRFAIPRQVLPGRLRLQLDVGVHGGNLLNNRNVLAIGSVIGSPTFGKAIAAQPGRVMRVTFSLL